MSLHHGSCHCGAVQFDAELELTGLMTCNCSICGRTGSIMAFLPESKLVRGPGVDKLTDYQFGKKNVHHVFCSVCGVRPYSWGTTADGARHAMVNVRCLDGVDVHQLEIARQYDGRAL